jgi:hypothetical protein
MRRQEAQRAIGALEPRLARLVITPHGSDVVVAVELDGHVVPLALLGVEIPVDPGEHRIVLRGAAGASAEQSVTAAEGARQDAVLTVDLPPPTARGSSAPPGAGSSAPPAAGGTAASVNGHVSSVSALERIRLSAENRAHIIDPQGLRRWERTIVLGLFTGGGHPVGLVGITARWAARPWFDIEVQGGALSEFGPGAGLDFVLRYPWSYRYALGVQLGVSTNYTQIGGRYGCDNNVCNFTPLWLTAALVHEWRTAMGLTYRLSLGFKWLVNHSQLANAFASRRDMLGMGNYGSDLVLDSQPSFETFMLSRVNWDWPSYPVMPFVTFDIGWSL